MAKGPFTFPLLDVPRACPACGAESPRAMHVYRNHPQRRIVDADELILTGCQRCGFVFSAPLPTDAELQRFYAAGDGWEERVADPGEKDAEDDDAHAQVLERKRERYRRELELLEPSLDLPPTDAPRRVFDFGCGLGAWLDVLAERGWETAGLEPGPVQRRLAGERHRIVDKVPAEGGFDLVIVHHVLEHLRDPAAILRDLREALRPGGNLLIATPNFGALGRHGKFSYVASSVHIASYTPAGLRNLLALTGFDWIAELAGEEWDTGGQRPGQRLRALARRADDVAPLPAPAALGDAEQALVAYGKAREARAAAAPPPPPPTVLDRVAARINDARRERRRRKRRERR